MVVACSSFDYWDGLLGRLCYYLCFSPLVLILGCACRFAAALKDLKVWVMNVVSVDSPDTLPIIYERGLFGMYHDWCESFNTYPRSYDLLHADHLFSKVKKRCAEIFFFLFLITETLFI
jgi:hypothetical protein